MNVAQRLATNSGAQAGAFAAKAAAGFLLYWALARLSGPAALGVFASAWTLLTFASAVAAFGLPELLTREVARLDGQPEMINTLTSRALWLASFVSIPVAALVIVAVIALGLPGFTPLAYLLIGAGVVIEALASVLVAPFLGVQRMGWPAITDAVMELSFLVVGVTTLLVGSGISGLMFAFCFSRVLSGGLALYLYVVKFGRPRLPTHRAGGRQLATLSLPFVLNNALSLVYIRLDVLLLSSLVGSAAVGLYEAATSLTIRVNILARLVNSALYPLLSSQYQRSKDTVHTYASQTLHYLLLPGVFITLLLWLLAPTVIMTIYGEAFLGATVALQALALIIPLRFINHTLAVTLTATNRQSGRTLAVATAAAVNLALNLALIPELKVAGAVYATIASEGVLALVLAWHLRGELGALLSWSMLRAPTAGALAIACLATLLRTNQPLLLVLLSGIVYALVVLCLDFVRLHTLLLALAARSR